MPDSRLDAHLTVWPNSRLEGLNSRVRLIINIARGFRSVQALMAIMQLHLGVYQPTLPGRRPPPPPRRRPSTRPTPSWLAP
jgi:hypothetical protein